MISWIQNTLERKGRIIFILLLAAVIVSFVFVIGETPGCVSGEVGAQSRDYYGYNLNSEAETRPLVHEVIVSSIVNRGQRPQDPQMLEQEFLSRAALLYLANQAKIPEPSQEAFVRYLSGIPFFQDQEGNFDPSRVTSFLDLTQLSRQFDEATINRTLNNDYRIQQLMESIAPPGFTVPFEVEVQARRSIATYSLSLAYLDADSVDAVTAPTDEELQNFFSQQVEAYRIPETRVLSLAIFDPAKLASSIPDPTEAQLEEYFSANRSDYLNADAENPANALPQLSAVKSTVISDWKASQAETKATEASVEFIHTLYDKEIALDSPAFEQAKIDYSVTIETLPPIVGPTPPADSSLPEKAYREAFRLDQLRYFSDPIEIDDRVVVLLFKETIPSQIPDFESVRGEVAADYNERAQQEAFVARGAEIRDELAAVIAGGTSFLDAADSLGLSAISYDNAGWEQTNEGLDNSLIRRAETLPDQEVSAMFVTVDGGTFLFVEDRSAPAVGPDSETYERARVALASNTSRLFLSSFVSDLVQSGLAMSQSENP